MKQVVLSLLGTLLGVGMALLAYDRFVVQPRETKRAEAVTLDLAQTAEDARKISEGLDASVKQSVDSARQAFDAQAADQNKRRMASEAIAQTQLYKVALTESFMANGKWPARASEAGLQQNNTRAGGAIRNIAVGERGTVTVTFDNHFSEGARLELIPDANPDTYQVNWRCRTSGDADLKRYLPHCSAG
jgi:type II secretory pathway pseudopilin PulG